MKARRYYRGAEIAVRHQLTKASYLQASYIYSKLVGNYEGLMMTVSTGHKYFASPGFSPAFDYPVTLTNNFGRLANDRRHQAKLAGYHTFPFGLTVGVMGQFWSGQPLSLYRAAGLSSIPIFLIPRGSYGELPSTYSVDLHLEYSQGFGTLTVSPALDVFNVTNVQRATSRDQVYTYSRNPADSAPPFTHPTNNLFGKDVEWQKPRLVRLGMRVAF